MPISLYNRRKEKISRLQVCFAPSQSYFNFGRFSNSKIPYFLRLVTGGSPSTVGRKEIPQEMMRGLKGAEGGAETPLAAGEGRVEAREEVVAVGVAAGATMRAVRRVMDKEEGQVAPISPINLTKQRSIPCRYKPIPIPAELPTSTLFSPRKGRTTLYII